MSIREPGAVITSALLVSLVAGCVQPPAISRQARNPVYASDLQGKAASCTASSTVPEAGKTVTATITTDGHGWCGLTLANGDQPFAAGLVERRPEKGHVFIHTVGDDTRVDYTPDAIAVADSFSVRLIPGDATVTVSVQPASAATTQPASPPPAHIPAANKGVAK